MYINHMYVLSSEGYFFLAQLRTLRAPDIECLFLEQGKPLSKSIYKYARIWNAWTVSLRSILELFATLGLGYCACARKNLALSH